MISRLENNGSFSEPLLEPVDVANAIVRQVMSGNSGQVVLPSWMAIVKGMKGWPTWIQERVRDSQQGVLAHVEPEGVGGVLKVAEAEDRKNV